MLNAQTIGGKKGTRWRDDVWTMKYLPKFKWNMLTEQVGGYRSIRLFSQLLIVTFTAHEAAIHTAKLRVELSQSRSEQRDYLKNVELARVLNKRAEKKKEKGEELEFKERPRKRPIQDTEGDDDKARNKRSKPPTSTVDMSNVLNSIF